MSTTRPLRADAERNRARILAAAAEVFAERGLDVSLDDIAAHAGVGVGTVSRVINGSAAVSEATRRRVLDVVAELGYEPNATARALSTGRTASIGVVAPFFTRSSVIERLRGVVQVPADAVFVTPDGPVAYRRTGGGFERVRLELGGRQRHGEHRASRQPVDQPRPRRHEVERIGEREDAGEAGRHVFAEAVADHRPRPDRRQRHPGGPRRS